VQAHQPAGADFTAVDVDEDERVLNWRFEQFLRLGFDAIQAVLLASSAVDLHLTRTLIGRGCPHSLAIKIAF
jgi:hypothetical protein